MELRFPSMRRVSSFAFFIVALLAAPVASAHLYQPSYEQQVGPYLIDIGYSIVPVVGTPVRFDLDLYTNTGADVNYSPFHDIVVTITDGQKTLLSQTIQNDTQNVPTFNYTFPAVGTYTINAVYERTNDTPIPVEFTLTAGTGSVPILPTIIVLCVAAFLVGLFFLRRRRLQTK